jgi:general nucleoside transport system permease protein
MLEDILSAGARIAVPILFAALGEMLIERSGMLNLGIEGIMEVGAITAFLTFVFTQSTGMSLAFAILTGIILGLVFAFMVVNLYANQVLTGLSIWVLGEGIAAFAYKVFLPKLPSITIDGVPRMPIPFLEKLPLLGGVFSQDLFLYASFPLIFLLWFLIYKTSFGLTVRAVGHMPTAARDLGISPRWVKYICILAGVSLMSVGGAYLTLTITNAYYHPTPFIGIMSLRGFIAIIIVILGSWHPVRIGIAALFFGIADATQMRLQNLYPAVPTYFYIMLPYLAAFITLILLRRGEKPLDLTNAYVQEK